MVELHGELVSFYAVCRSEVKDLMKEEAVKDTAHIQVCMGQLGELHTLYFVHAVGMLH